VLVAVTGDMFNTDNRGTDASGSPYPFAIVA